MIQNVGSKLIVLVVALLTGVGVWLRLTFIADVQLYPDEFVTLLAVAQIQELGVPEMPSGLFYEHGLLFSYAGSVAALFESPRWAVRSASLLFGLLTIGVAFGMGRRWFSLPVATLAATGLIIAPAAIEWSSRARMYALLQLLVLATLWLLYEGLTQNKPRYRWAGLVTYLAATLTHFAAVALAPPLVLATLIVAWLQKRWTVSRLELVGLGGVLAIAFLVKRWGQPKGIEPLELSNAASGFVEVFSIYSELSLNVWESWQALAPFFTNLPALVYVPFALLAIAIVLWKQSESRLPVIFLATVLVCTTLEMLLLVSPERRDDKYLFMLLPVLFLLGAQGMHLLIARWPRFEAVSTIGASLLIVGMSWSAVETLLSNTGDDYDAAFAYVAAQWQPGDTILTGTPAAAAFYLNGNDFYSVQRRGGYDYRILTQDGQAVDRWLASPAIRTEAQLHETLAQNDVWLVLERWGLQREYYDLPFQQQLLAQTDYIHETQGIFILRSKDQPQPIHLEPRQSVDVVFGEQVALHGYTLEPESPQPGQPVRVTLYWQALAPMPHDYTVFMHLRNADGVTVAQADHRPLGPLYPTSVWPVGATIRETSLLYLPAELPADEYTLWTGLYLLETGERLPIRNDTSGEHAAQLTPMEITDYGQ